MTPLLPSATFGLPQVAPATTSTRPNAAATASHAGFERLMGLQQRARDMSKQVRAANATPDSQDPAREATRRQQLRHADELDKLRELVGPRPGSNTRRAFAAVLDRGSPQPGDIATVRLAQAADSGRIPPAAGAQLRATIAAIIGALGSIQASTQDPTLIQDPARLGQLRERMTASQKALDELTGLLASGDAAAVAPLLARAAAQNNPGHVIRDVLAALRG